MRGTHSWDDHKHVRGRRLAIKGLEIKEILASWSLVNSLFKLSFFNFFIHMKPGNVYDIFNKHYLSVLSFSVFPSELTFSHLYSYYIIFSLGQIHGAWPRRLPLSKSFCREPNHSLDPREDHSKLWPTHVESTMPWASYSGVDSLNGSETPWDLQNPEVEHTEL